MSNYIPQNLKHLRESRNFSKTEVSNKIGKVLSVIGSYESGKTQPPVDVLSKYAELFGVSVGDIIDKDLSAAEAVGEVVNEPAAAYGDPAASLLREQRDLLQKQLDIRLKEVSVLNQAILGDEHALAELERIDPRLATHLKTLHGEKNKQENPE